MERHSRTLTLLVFFAFLFFLSPYLLFAHAKLLGHIAYYAICVVIMSQYWIIPAKMGKYRAAHREEYLAATDPNYAGLRRSLKTINESLASVGISPIAESLVLYGKTTPEVSKEVPKPAIAKQIPDKEKFFH